MLRSVSASVMCLGLATLGIAVLRGEDPAKPEAEQVQIISDGVNLVIEESASAAPATPATPPTESGKASFTAKEDSEGGETVEIQIGSDEGLLDGQKDGLRVRFRGGNAGNGIVILNDEGKASEPRPTTIRKVAPQAAQVNTRFIRHLDPESHEAVEKLLAGLREEAKRLEKEGKAEEAAQKTKAIQALERLLKSQPMAMGAGRAVFFTQNGEKSLELEFATDELKKSQQIREQLAQRLKTLAPDSEPAALIRQELQAYDEKIASQQKKIEAKRAEVGTTVRYVPAPPGMQVTPGGMAGMMRGTAGPGVIHGMATGWGTLPARAPSKAAALAHQAEVLSQSAARLKEAGLEDQAKQLAEQAEKLKDQAAMHAKREAEQLAAQAHAAGGIGGGGISFIAGPPVELHRSIKELQEQVQMLRKEVAELKELLQTKR